MFRVCYNLLGSFPNTGKRVKYHLNEGDSHRLFGYQIHGINDTLLALEQAAECNRRAGEAFAIPIAF